MRFSRTFRLIVAPMATVLFLLLAHFLGTLGLLPDPVAVHWGITGEPDGFLPLDSFLWFTGFGFFALWLGLAATELVPSRTKLLRPLLRGLLTYLYIFIFLVVASTTLLQIGALDAGSSLSGVWIYILLIPVVALVWLFLAKPQVVMEEHLVVSLRGIQIIKIPIEQVEAIEITTLQARSYGGWGLRYASKTLAFIPSSGEGILITLDWGEKIAVRMDNPSAFLANQKSTR